jgi:hypothetical protein
MSQINGIVLRIREEQADEFERGVPGAGAAHLETARRGR